MFCGDKTTWFKCCKTCLCVILDVNKFVVDI